MMKRRFLILYFLIAFASIASNTYSTTKSFVFEPFSLNDKLSSNSVTRTFQDRDGYVWFGTKDGLCRFDGYDIKVFSEEGYELEAHHEGYLVIKLPLAPGALMGIWNDPERFKFGYLSRFPGYYFSGDGAIKDEDGYVFVTGRVDDVINVAGHRLSTAEMEEVVSGHKDVAECCVVGIDDDLKGQIPFAIAVLKTGSKAEENALEKEIVELVREKIGPVACLKNAMIVNRLPKTRSGKILRKLIRTMLDGKDFQMPSTIDDEAIVGEIQDRIKEYRG